MESSCPSLLATNPEGKTAEEERKGGEATNVVSVGWFQEDFPPCPEVCACVCVKIRVLPREDTQGGLRGLPQ